MGNDHERLYAFWRYDQFPYVLGGAVVQMHADGLVETENYGRGAHFRPIKLTLPAELGAALTTGRLEFTDMLIARLTKAAGECASPDSPVGGLPFDQQIDLVKLVRDLISDRVRLQARLDAADRCLDALEDFARGVGNKTAQLRELVSATRDLRYTHNGDCECRVCHEAP
jgi:hypothetical protein